MVKYPRITNNVKALPPLLQLAWWENRLKQNLLRVGDKEGKLTYKTHGHRGIQPLPKLWPNHEAGESKGQLYHTLILPYFYIFSITVSPFPEIRERGVHILQSMEVG